MITYKKHDKFINNLHWYFFKIEDVNSAGYYGVIWKDGEFLCDEFISKADINKYYTKVDRFPWEFKDE